MTVTVRVRSLCCLRRTLPQRSLTLARQDVNAYAHWTLFIAQLTGGQLQYTYQATDGQ